MEEFYLEVPSINREKEVIEYCNELVKYNSDINGIEVLTRILHGYTFHDTLDYSLRLGTEEYAKKLGKAQVKTYLLVRKNDNVVVGASNIRFNYPGGIRKFDGNIGYGIRPTERGKGYSKVLLYLTLLECKKLEFKEVKLVCEKSNIEITKEALNIIAVLSEGAMRDALSILERCIQDGENKIDEDKIKDLVGIPKITYIHQLTESILEYDVDKALANIDEVLEDGKDINNLLWELIKYVKDILVFKTNTKLEIYSEAEKNQIKELADSTTKERLISMIYELSNLQNDMKWSSQKLIMFQVTIIKLCNEASTSSTVSSGDSGASSKEVEDLKYKINRLEKQITQLQNAPRAVASSSTSQESKTQYAIKPEVKKSTNVKLGDKVQNWPKIIDNIKQEGRISLSSILMTSSANEINDMTVGINFENGLTPFRKDILEKPENMSEIVKQVSMELGKPMRVVLVDNNEEIVSKTDTFSDISNGLDIPINIID